MWQNQHKTSTHRNVVLKIGCLNNNFFLGLSYKKMGEMLTFFVFLGFLFNTCTIN